LGAERAVLHPTDATERVTAAVEGQVVRSGTVDGLVGVAEHRGVEPPAGLGIGQGGLAPHQRAGLVVDLHADVSSGLPHPEGRALRVERDAQPPTARDVERLGEQRPLILSDHLGGRVHGVTGQVRRPYRGLALVLAWADAGSGPTVALAHLVVAVLLAGVGEGPAEHRSVELGGGGDVGDGEVDPAGSAGRPGVGAGGHGNLQV
jgi:hypothetical protein